MKTLANNQARDIQPGRVYQALLKPFRIASVVAALALLVSLLFLAYTAWSSAQRFNPLESHLRHLHQLQKSSLQIQSVLIRQIEHKTPPGPAEISAIADQVRTILDSADHLHPLTPERLQQAVSYLRRQTVNPEAGLLASLTLVRDTLSDENEMQRDAVGSARRLAQSEFMVATIALFLAPLTSFLLLETIRRRSFKSLGRLSELLDNVGNLEFRTLADTNADDPLYPAFSRYNQMAERLQRATDLANQRRASLEEQVRIASETLLRQQAALADGAKLAALGEFSARLAHELRNPVSGIAVALKNLEIETDNPEHRDRLRLVSAEMTRITNLLNELLRQTPAGPELAVSVNTRALVTDVVRLFRFYPGHSVELRVDAEDCECRLARDTVAQVLLNLLRNSAEAIGQSAGVIEVRTRCEGGTFRLELSDSGPGYPEDLLRYGIRPFQSGKLHGTGLGMTIIERLVRAAGGELRLSGSSDDGARTIVLLPCED